VSDRHAGDREILDRAQGVHAPVGVARDLALAQEVVLAPGDDLGKIEGLGGCDGEGFGHGQDRSPVLPAARAGASLKRRRRAPVPDMVIRPAERRPGLSPSSKAMAKPMPSIPPLAISASMSRFRVFRPCPGI
jgi:hypothetical protein